MLSTMAVLIAMLGAVLVAAPAMATPGDQVCAPLSSGKIDTTGDPMTVTITAGPGELITSYCVKGGSANQGDGPVYVTLAQPVASLTISHPSGKAISHYSFAVTTAPTPTSVAVPPTLVDECGPGYALAVPPAGPGYGFSTDESGAPGGSGVVVVTATLAPGFVWSDGSTAPRTWSFPVTAEPCVQQAPEPMPPTVVDECGAGYALAVPADTEAYAYSVDASGVVDGAGVVVVTATLADGLVRADGSTEPVQWRLTVSADDCAVAAIEPPTFLEVCGPDGEMPYVLPADGEHHRYLVDDPGTYVDGRRVVVVTAVLDEGWSAPEGAATTWTRTLYDAPCDTAVASAEVLVTPATCTAPGAVELGAIEHATWDPVEPAQVDAAAAADADAAAPPASIEVVVVARAEEGASFDLDLPGVSSDGSTRTFVVLVPAADPRLCPAQPPVTQPPVTQPPATVAPPTPSIVRAVAAAPRAQAPHPVVAALPRTGMDVTGLLVLGSLLALAGAGLAARPRREG